MSRPILVHHMTLVSLRQCFVKTWATCENFCANGSLPPAKNSLYAFTKLTQGAVVLLASATFKKLKP